MEQTEDKSIKGKKKYLIISVLVNLGVLAGFKYLTFFSQSINDLFNILGINAGLPIYQILLPVGISFYTFQTMSYTIDVYRGKIPAEKHFGIFAVYVSFFPQLVAGPIERATNLLPQFKKEQKPDYERIINGLKLMLWGFFKKVVIADRLAIVVNTVYADPTGYSSTALIIATIFFAYQIYCDFSGYSDIAIGVAQVMGFNLMDNFKRPYFSKSIREFWKRWHISLSSWFQDYLYIPLGGNRVAIPRWYFNLFIVFLISGLWHGANWTFVAWGALHGIYLIIGIATTKTRKKIQEKTGITKYPKLLTGIKIATVFALVNIGWILFRAQSISDAWYIITHLFTNIILDKSAVSLGISLSALIINILLILILELFHLIQEHKGMRAFLSTKPRWLRWSAYITIIILIIAFGMYEVSEFIYFQF